MGATQAKSKVSFYVLIYGGLLFLTALSVLLSFLLHDSSSHTVLISLVLVLSTVKALMIALYYMHLAEEKIPVRIWAYMAIAIFVILFVLALPDGIANLKQ